MTIIHPFIAVAKRCATAISALVLAAIAPVNSAMAQETAPAQSDASATLYRVVDQADLITLDNEKLLVDKLVGLETASGPRFVIVTVRSLEGKPIEDVSMLLFESWALDRMERKDGVLLIVAPNEKQVRIEVGHGLEGPLDNTFCAWVIRENMLPLFRTGDMQGAIIAGAEQLIARLQQNPTRPQAQREGNNQNG